MRFRFHGSWLGKSTWQVDLASRLINNLRKKKTVASFVDSFHVSWTCFQRRISLVSSINHILYLVLPSFTFSIVFFLLSLVFTLLSRVVSSWKRVVVLYRPPSLTYLFFFSKCFQKIIFFPPFSSTIRRRQPSPASARSSGDKCDGDLDLVVFLFFFLSFQCRRFLSLFRARRRSDGRALAVALIAVAPRDPQPIKWRCGRYRTAIGSIIKKKHTHETFFASWRNRIRCRGYRLVGPSRSSFVFLGSFSFAFSTERIDIDLEPVDVFFRSDLVGTDL